MISIYVCPTDHEFGVCVDDISECQRMLVVSTSTKICLSNIRAGSTDVVFPCPHCSENPVDNFQSIGSD